MTIVIFKILNFLLSIETHFGIPNLRYMDKAKLSETSYSSNMLGFPANEERVLAHLLVTKFHTEPVIYSRLKVRLNPIIKDLVINSPSAKKERSKRHKKEESTVEVDESVGENQPVWLDPYLKVEISKMK
jgi:hypothetical protein